jgi:G3E family GTPase
VAALAAARAPEVFVAEPVGSCTDLAATVSYPLRRLYGERYTIAPLSVLVDPLRAERVLGLEAGRAFSPKVQYVYEKQLEEADLLVINKADLLDGPRRARLVAALTERFPAARVLAVSARDGTGLEPWFEAVLSEEGTARATMELDYRRYAEGEALLGWLNATVALEGREPFDAGELLRALGETLRARLAPAEIAHLKFTLDPGLPGGPLAALSLVASDGPVDERETLLDRVDRGSLVVNLRAEAAPEALETALVQALRELLSRPGAPRYRLENLERFRPAPPVPVHRDEVPAAGART